MNDGDLVGLLLANYSKQYEIYKELLKNLSSGLTENGGKAAIYPIIQILSARNRAFDLIKELDDQITPHKIGWDRRKNDLHTVEAETLKAMLAKIKTILSDILVANTKLENVLAGLQEGSQAI
ncbi:MAG: hypothetical protein A2268_09675 [Candidatus Raymondbacteria bacterium RifOxyA12_full_50_37]|uniref:Uncharacterized protein n=1 Tax=Candidatus Raymondbacteria bacterium RIFOXYD12_FULL_49_13 TaxID=1817890 RepID=A0A1F7F1N3_UNCRA|nr:MAG: hypothetical protein A2268_09675 [Candidatus Raymondbacteria bacterium RifOxyA12_full_50_37]OGJ93154.1 MAG: hypothetical protein A2350_17870 [Candidatus Raymondbacteria bacterium RifOxyB12_full_50_8]OGJ93891.1 MAG: hypothetical protein A2248_06620 [Candidatus Raymondbacteria bacterium RIFOXYA2_FULL_49_16]OGJ98240.1 MAG: hypothetical protein A2453_00545 [Candidatus Raymondbacteria bacterium RIFOXYC2_FULL_50_21]OGK00473.1 MAG: hypothetical protein A2519_10720 [Candidatus Raymondbacteria b